MSDPSDFPPDPAKKAEAGLSHEQELAKQLKDMHTVDNEVHTIYEHPDMAKLGANEADVEPPKTAEDRAAEQTEKGQEESEKDQMTEEQLREMEQNLSKQAVDLREQAAKLARSFEYVVAALRQIVGRGENPSLEQLYVDTTTGLSQMELSAQEMQRDGRLLESGVNGDIAAKQYGNINDRFQETINTISGNSDRMTDNASTLLRQVDRFFEQTSMPDQKPKQDAVAAAVEAARSASAEFKTRYNA